MSSIRNDKYVVTIGKRTIKPQEDDTSNDNYRQEHTTRDSSLGEIRMPHSPKIALVDEDGTIIDYNELDCLECESQTKIVKSIRPYKVVCTKDASHRFNISDYDIPE